MIFQQKNNNTDTLIVGTRFLRWKSIDNYLPEIFMIRKKIHHKFNYYIKQYVKKRLLNVKEIFIEFYISDHDACYV